MPVLASTLLSVAMLAAFALAIFGVRMLRRDRQKGLLMLAAALVILANVLIWTV